MAKARRRDHAEPCAVTVAEIKEALVYTAYLVEKYGDGYAPMMHSLLAHLERAQREEPPRSIAQRILKSQTFDGGLKAIR